MLLVDYQDTRKYRIDADLIYSNTAVTLIEQSHAAKHVL